MHGYVKRAKTSRERWWLERINQSLFKCLWAFHVFVTIFNGCEIKGREKRDETDAGAPPACQLKPSSRWWVGLNNSMTRLHYFHILSSQSQTPPRVLTLSSLTAVVSWQSTGGQQTGSSFFLGFWWRVWQKMCAHLSPRGCGLVTLLRIASPALYCRDSEPARPFLGVLPQSFFVVAVKFFSTVCLWIWTYSRTEMFHRAANSFLLYFSIHSNWHHPLF